MRCSARLLVLAVFITGCGGAGNEAVTGVRSNAPLVPTTRDSAGIIIHEHPADLIERAPRITVDSTPLAVIGGADEVDLDLSRVYPPVELGDGRLAVFVNGSIWIFGADGETLETIGRRGAGPAEFRDAQLARGLADTIIANDFPNGRLALVVPGEGIVRLRQARTSIERISYAPIGQVGDDDFLLGPWGISYSAGTPLGPMSLPVGRLRPGADSIEVITTLIGPSLRQRPGRPEQILMESHSPWGKAAVTPDGVVAADGVRWIVRRLDADGMTTALITAPRAREPITEAMRELEIEARIRMYREQLASGSSFGGDTSAVIAMLRSTVFADSLPHFIAMQATPAGTVWLGLPRLISDSTWRHLALDRDGRVLGIVSGQLPQPVMLGDDRVILRKEDPDGIVSWQVHRLEFPGR